MFKCLFFVCSQVVGYFGGLNVGYVLLDVVYVRIQCGVHVLLWCPVAFLTVYVFVRLHVSVLFRFVMKKKFKSKSVGKFSHVSLYFVPVNVLWCGAKVESA